MLAPYVWMGLQKKRIRHEVKERMIKGMEEEDLVRLTFSKSEVKKKLSWEHSKEFEFDGEKYDVVYSRSSFDSITYYCWWDHEETELEITLNQLVKQSFGRDEASQEGRLILTSYFKTNYTIPDICTFLTYQNECLTHFSCTNPFLISGHKNAPTTPPPDLI